MAQKPDFSGEYLLNRPASALDGGAAEVRSAVLRIDHREPTFRCQGEERIRGGGRDQDNVWVFDRR